MLSTKEVEFTSQLLFYFAAPICFWSTLSKLVSKNSVFHSDLFVYGQNCGEY